VYEYMPSLWVFESVWECMLAFGEGAAVDVDRLSYPSVARR